MNTIFILYVVLSVGSTPRPVAFTTEHASKQACEAARDMIRESASGATVHLLKCTPK